MPTSAAIRPPIFKNNMRNPPNIATLPAHSREALELIAQCTEPPTNAWLAEQFGEHSGQVNRQKASVRLRLSPLTRRGLVVSSRVGSHKTIYTVTDAGHKVLQPPAPVGKLTPPRGLNHDRSALYCGSELKPYTGRPGAMAAFDLPSLVGGQRIERTAPAIFAHRAVEAATKHQRALV